MSPVRAIPAPGYQARIRVLSYNPARKSALFRQRLE